MNNHARAWKQQSDNVHQAAINTCIKLRMVQGFETFESCFKTLAGRNLLPYTMEDTAGVMRWLSPLRRHSDVDAKDDRQRCNLRSSAARVILIALSILALILMIAATHHPRTQVRSK